MKSNTKLSETQRIHYDRALLQKLKTDRQQTVEARWDFAIEYVVPFLNEWGDKTWTDRRYDTTATEASSQLADGQFGNMLSPNSDWIRYTTDNEELNNNADFADYLKARQMALYTELRKSNFYDVMPECLQVGNSIETANVYVEEEEGEGRISLSARHPWEIYLTQDKYGKVNRIVREFQLTAEQAGQQFDVKNMSHALKEAVEDEEKSQETYWFVHIIERRKDRDERKPDAKNMPIASRFFERDGEDHYLHEGGYKTWPMPIWRWKSRSNSPYGYGPTSDLKPKIQAANQIQKDLYKANHKATDPPYQTKKTMRGKVNLNPGKGTYYSDPSTEQVREMPSVSNLAAGYAELESTQEQIKTGYKVDHFLMLLNDEDTQKTAREIYERKAEKTTVIGSTVGKFESEFLTPTLERIDQLGIDSGRIPQVPEEFIEQYGGTEIKFEFLGPLSQAQKQLVETQGIVQALQVAMLIGEINPTTFDNLDADETFRNLITSYGAAERLRDEKSVEKLRAARAQKQAEQEAFIKQTEMAKAAPGLAKAAEMGQQQELQNVG